MRQEKVIVYIGTISMFFGIALFLANLDQARLNLQGEKGSILLTTALLVNCICRVIYGLIKKDKAVRIANGVGVITSIIVIFTYFM